MRLLPVLIGLNVDVIVFVGVCRFQSCRVFLAAPCVPSIFKKGSEREPREKYEILKKSGIKLKKENEHVKMKMKT